MKNAPDGEPGDWQMTDKRRDRMNAATDNLKDLVNRDLPPSFDETQAAIDKLTYEFETARNA